MPSPDMSRRALLSLAAAVPALTACATTRGAAPADLRIIYNRPAQHHRPDRNPIIVIPGILGSRLVDVSTRQTIWGAFDGKAASPTNPEDLRRIALPLTGALNDRPDADNVEPEGVLDHVSVRLAGIPFQLRQYAHILATLGAGGYRDQALGLGGIDYGGDHFTCFQFAFDWRRDNAENAGALKRFMDAQRLYVAEQYQSRFGMAVTPQSIQFDVVAHSMGALLLRYFLRYGDQPLNDADPDPALDWSGVPYVGRAILVAPPNAGSALGLKHLVQGEDLGRPVFPFYPPALLGSFPALYQLLPRARHHALLLAGDPGRPVADLLAPELWRANRWGLADPGQAPVLAALLPDVASASARAEIALARQGELLSRARRFQAALDAPALAPAGLETFLVAADNIPTDRTYSVDPDTGRLTLSAQAPGDGSVTRASALADERTDGDWTPQVRSHLNFRSTLLVQGDHLGLTRSPVFQDNVLYWLLEEPRDSASFRAAI